MWINNEQPIDLVNLKPIWKESYIRITKRMRQCGPMI